MEKIFSQESSILDIWLGSEYAFFISFTNFDHLPIYGQLVKYVP